ncbi:hypothetical protein VKT23_008227 [Stygiomarasmius scandens]|uniref:Uncharacterized protein n=1 Tax=Marasmiellus scandens TaxID=2682957 RepID=A0ABR1JM95_9AGAR
MPHAITSTAAISHYQRYQLYLQWYFSIGTSLGTGPFDFKAGTNFTNHAADTINDDIHDHVFSLYIHFAGLNIREEKPDSDLTNFDGHVWYNRGTLYAFIHVLPALAQVLDMMFIITSSTVTVTSKCMDHDKGQSNPQRTGVS